MSSVSLQSRSLFLSVDSPTLSSFPVLVGKSEGDFVFLFYFFRTSSGFGDTDYLLMMFTLISPDLTPRQTNEPFNKGILNSAENSRKRTAKEITTQEEKEANRDPEGSRIKMY